MNATPISSVTSPGMMKAQRQPKKLADHAGHQRR